MLETAKVIARDAAAILRKGQSQGFTIDSKSSAIDLVTTYDRESEKLIVARLREAFPSHGVIGEEGSSYSGSSDEGFFWYIDPLDGTNNFAHRIPQFAVSLGLFRKDQPLICVVHDVMRDLQYWAEAGKGAYCNGTPLKVSSAPTIERSLLASGFSYDRLFSPIDNLAQVNLFLKKCQGFRRFGAASLDLAMLASGCLDGYWEFKLSSWDIAAGVLLVTEAGGTVTRIDGSPLGYLTEKNHILVSNGLIHQEMLEVILPTLTPEHLVTGKIIGAKR